MLIGCYSLGESRSALPVLCSIYRLNFVPYKGELIGVLETAYHFFNRVLHVHRTVFVHASGELGPESCLRFVGIVVEHVFVVRVSHVDDTCAVDGRVLATGRNRAYIGLIAGPRSSCMPVN